LINRRVRFTRWIYLAFIVLFVVPHHPSLGFPQFSFSIASAHTWTLCSIAILLFLPASSKWFKVRNTVSENSSETSS
jgi:hypothetical protein